MKDRIIRSTCVLLALLGLVATAGPADKPPATQPKVTFKVVKAPYAVEMFGEDPILTEGMKYVAVVRARLGEWGWGALLSARDQLRGWVERTPKQHLPSEEIRSFLMTQAGRAIRHTVSGRWTGTRRDTSRYSWPGASMRPGAPIGPRPSRVPSAGAGAFGTRTLGPRPYQPPPRRPARPMGRVGAAPRPLERPREAPVHEFLILAPSEERARQLVQALIVVYNHGWAYPGRKDALQAAENEKARLPELQAHLAEAEKRLADIQAEVNRHEDIGEEGLSALKSEKWLLAVKLAGVKARLKAVGRLAGPGQGRGDEYHVQLATIRLTTEIDLADLLARMGRADQLIVSATRRQQLEGQLLNADRSTAGSRHGVERCKNSIAANEQNAKGELYAPFKLLDEAVPIHPIKWVKPPPPPPGPGFPPGARYPRPGTVRPGTGGYRYRTPGARSSPDRYPASGVRSGR